MARDTTQKSSELYALHQHWIGNVLPSGSSLIPSNNFVWSSQCLDEVDRHFVGQPDLTKDKKFLDKLRDQMAGSSPEAVQLMAELHVVHFLHIWNGAVSASHKRSTIEAILSWMPSPPMLTPAIVATFAPGIVHPGQWVMTRRDTQLAWLIHFAQEWRRLDHPEQERLLSDPWAFKTFVFRVESPSSDSARHAMLHMTHPDTFDPIVSSAHKELIAQRFSELGGADPDVDRRLLAIRNALTAQYGQDFDWYRSDLDLRWDKRPKIWSPFLSWLQQFRSAENFDAEERDYKLRLATRLAATRRLVLNADPDWEESLSLAFSDKDNNITLWRAHAPFLQWVKRDRDLARAALVALWQEGGTARESLDAFLKLVPREVLPTRAERVNIGSFLLMADDAFSHPPMKVSTLRAAGKLLGWPRDTEAMTDADVYQRGILLFEEILREGSMWAVPLRDLLDAQGAVWALLTNKQRPPGWADALWQQLLAYRATSADPADDDWDSDDSDHSEVLEIDEPVVTIDHIAAAAKELYVDREHLDEIVQLLEDKSQVVLYGPPGTGKTYLALRLARAIAEGDESRVSVVQFHPATTCEDFIEGLRPRLTELGQVTYAVVPGPLVRIAKQAAKDPSHRYVLVVDEINRANLPKVFGELLFLLEYRHERANMIHREAEPFGLPANLWIVGTMNTADRSIALIDAAMRRRFHFVPFFPHEGPMKTLLQRWLADKGGRVGVAALLDAANAELRVDFGDHLLIGPSHFMRTDLSDVALGRIWTYNVFPVIEELYWGDRNAVDRWRWSAVHQRFAASLNGPMPVAVPDTSEDADPVRVASEIHAEVEGEPST